MIDPDLPECPPPELTDRTLRQFAGLCVLALGGLALWQGLRAERLGWVIALASTAVAIGLVGLIRPQAIRPIFTGAMAATYPIGRLTSFVLLSGFFYLVFTPIGLLLRILGRDTLALRGGRPATYLSPKPAAPDLQSYFRQS